MGVALRKNALYKVVEKRSLLRHGVTFTLYNIARGVIFIYCINVNRCNVTRESRIRGKNFTRKSKTFFQNRCA